MESSSDDDEPNPYDDMFANFTENDFLRLIRELKRQIYAVFKEAGEIYLENIECLACKIRCMFAFLESNLKEANHIVIFLVLIYYLD